MNTSLNTYFNIDTFNSKSSVINNGDFRLNAEFYSHDNNFRLLDRISTSRLSNIADVLGFGPFKRYYIDSPQFGIPLISSSEMMEVNPTCEGIISKEFTKDFQKYIVHNKTILVSCSGTIGNVTLVDSRLDGMAISQHALRVIPKKSIETGLIYTFLSSKFGKSLITGKKSGAVIDEIYKDDLNIIDIPIPNQKIIVELDNKIIRAYAKRDQANIFINKAQSLIHQYNCLPPLTEAETTTLSPVQKVEIMRVNIKEFTNDYRLDAHFYNPIADLAVKNIKAFTVNYRYLYEIADCSFRGSRSTRNYVDKEHGTPFLSGKNIIQVRPVLKYISNSESGNIQEMLVKKNWILITRSGTLGRTILIWHNYENYAASEHLIRVVPNGNEVDQGYLHAFLSSKYGYHQLLRFKHGSVIDEITEEQISKTIIPLPTDSQQKEIGDLVRKAYELRAEAILLEDEAQDILAKALTND